MPVRAGLVAWDTVRPGWSWRCGTFSPQRRPSANGKSRRSAPPVPERSALFITIPAAKLPTAWIDDAEGVLKLLWLLVTTLRASVRVRQDLVLENLLLPPTRRLEPTDSNPTACSASHLGQTTLDSGAPVVCRLA
jgi:hypothetical protein